MIACWNGSLILKRQIQLQSRKTANLATRTYLDNRTSSRPVPAGSAPVGSAAIDDRREDGPEK